MQDTSFCKTHCRDARWWVSPRLECPQCTALLSSCAEMQREVFSHPPSSQPPLRARGSPPQIHRGVWQGWSLRCSRRTRSCPKWPRAVESSRDMAEDQAELAHLAERRLLATFSFLPLFPRSFSKHLRQSLGARCPQGGGWEGWRSAQLAGCLLEGATELKDLKLLGGSFPSPDLHK